MNMIVESDYLIHLKKSNSQLTYTSTWILPKHGKICMVEYVDYFFVIPNVKLLSNNSDIEKIFREAGFSVHVKRKRMLLWSYVIIYGIKSREDILYI